MSEWIITACIIEENYLEFPSFLKKHPGEKAPKSFTSIGNQNILKNRKIAVISSARCPGSLILKTYEFMRKMKYDGLSVISGFHSPMERECLNILMRGKQPIIICPARSIEGMRIKKEYRLPIEKGRLLILSPFDKKQSRISKELSEKRNYFIAAIANEILIPYAASGSKTEKLCVDLIKKGKRIKTFESEYNKKLLELGAETI